MISAAAQVPDVFLQTRGITSTDPAQNPSFHGWNQVHIWYCSSDSHLGDTSTGAHQAVSKCFTSMHDGLEPRQQGSRDACTCMDPNADPATLGPSAM